MAQAGIRDYETFARSLLESTGELPVSFEVFDDDLAGMQRQALKLAAWGKSVYVKIPITNTLRQPTNELIRALSREGVKVNVTAVFTPEQIDSLVDCFPSGTPGVVSVFAGRIADAGIDPAPILRHALQRFAAQEHVQLLWASVREVFNVVTAAEVGCQIVTVPIPMLEKLNSLGKDLTEFSLDTVKMFRKDAVASGFNL
jgi:transaldolase